MSINDIQRTYNKDEAQAAFWASTVGKEIYMEIDGRPGQLYTLQQVDQYTLIVLDSEGNMLLINKAGLRVAKLPDSELLLMFENMKMIHNSNLRAEKWKQEKNKKKWASAGQPTERKPYKPYTPNHNTSQLNPSPDTAPAQPAVQVAYKTKKVW